MSEMWGITECYLPDEEHLSRVPCLHEAFLEKAETSLTAENRGNAHIASKKKKKCYHGREKREHWSALGSSSVT